jgi:orotidine-5'-phosphate decarboxylase
MVRIVSKDKPHESIIFPLDNMDEERIGKMVDLLAPHVGAFKIGLEQIMRLGLKRAFELAAYNKVMLDPKLHDIPKTVERAMEVIASYQPWLCTVHASGGPEMVRAAVDKRSKTLVTGVTVLTSLDEKACREVYGDIPVAKVIEFARMLVHAGADAIVCSPLELEALRDDVRTDRLIRIVPGIRPEWAVAAGQTRFTTPAQAIRSGAHFLVIGDPIGSAADPVEAAKRIADEIASV